MKDTGVPAGFMTQRSLHVAIIMDGNGRWAEAQGLPRTAGHRAGAEALRRAVRTAPLLDVGTLTVYAFSSDNWKRPKSEVDALFTLFGIFLRRELAELRREGVRLSFIGRRDRLTATLRNAMADAEQQTSSGRRLHLRVAIDYSARDIILRAAALAPLGADQASMAAAIARVQGGAPAPDVDLVIRTGGEQRLSDFLLWESAYAEMFFLSAYWPDFTADHFAEAMAVFASRERRFGGVPQTAA